MTSAGVMRVAVGLYILLFFAYLFGPLVVMSVTAFNSSEFPSISPWNCVTGEWFDVLVKDKHLMGGLRSSLFVGIGVVLLAVPIGLAASLLITQLQKRARSIAYTVTISPILVPGVVLGISTLVFWERIDRVVLGVEDGFFYGGYFMTIIGQSTFIAAYAMLVFLARLQRFDPGLEEAALDLGATQAQVFRKILLPFLKPAIASAAVLAFLASFENYNTTVFTIVSESTLTTVLASKVRYGINPSISALAVIIIVLTLLGAVVHEYLKRKEEKTASALAAEGLPSGGSASRSRPMRIPVGALTGLVVLSLLTGLWLARSYDVDQCKVRVSEENRIHFEALKQQRLAEAKAKREASGESASVAVEANQAGRQYQGIFAPTNLGQQVGADTETETGAEATAEANQQGRQYQGIFDPGNLGKQVDSASEND
ncbi:MAG: ABC transporter permease [Proteobacteria bacterium]|nr:ABC transporter permease [Pseudomonadota bacterium]